MKICVVGVGYVGLVTARCVAEAGSAVVCMDNDDQKIARLKNGVIPNGMKISSCGSPEQSLSQLLSRFIQASVLLGPAFDRPRLDTVRTRR